MVEEKSHKPDYAKLYKDVFQKCEEDVTQIDKVKHFDELRSLTVKDELIRLEKERHTAKYHPTKFHYKAQRTMQAIEQQLGFYVGKETNPGKFDDLEPRKKIQMYTTVGVDTIDDLIDPEKD